MRLRAPTNAPSPGGRSLAASEFFTQVEDIPIRNDVEANSHKVYVYRFVSVGFEDIFGHEGHAYACMHYFGGHRRFQPCFVDHFEKRGATKK